MIRELLGQRSLIFTLVKRDLKIRYKASALGFLWSFGRPLALMLILWIVFSQFVGMRTAHPELPYALQLLGGILPWMYLTGALFEAQNSVLANESIIKKIKVHSAVFPVASVLANLVHTMFALLVLGVFLVLSPVPVGWELLLVPFVIVLQTLMLIGIAMILSSLQVFYRDVGSLSEIVIMGWFYLTPIIYPLQLARDKFRGDGNEFLYYVYLLNPMTPIVCAYRRTLFGPLFREGSHEMTDRTLFLSLGVMSLTTVILLAVGMTLFSRLSRRFADEL